MYNNYLKKEFASAGGTVYAIVEIDKERHLVKDTWVGIFGSQENFTFVLEFIAEQIHVYELKFWLADLRAMEGSFDSSRDWLSTVLMPKVIQSGLQKEAVVLPKNIFARLSTTDAILRIQQFELRQFDEITSAEEWLLND